MRQPISILCLLLPALLLAQESGHFGAAKYVPEDGAKLLIMGQDLGAVGGLVDYSEGYVDYLGHVPAGLTTYTGFPGLGGLAEKDNWGAGDVHAQAYVEDSTFDHSVIVIGLHLVNQLGSIIDGSADAVIDELGEWIRDQERPVFLRIGYEFDGSWNHYDPEEFKEAWIYLVHYFDKLGVKNVSYVWQAHGGNTANIGRWYPGDVYVNWMGYSHFDEPNPGANILSFAEIHDKPVMIAEATPRVDLKAGDGAEHWNEWYAPLFEKISGNKRIKALAYINVAWDSQSMWQGKGWGDSRVQINEVIQENWQTEIEKESWLLASDSLFDLLDYDQWQDSVVLGEGSVPTCNDQLIIRSQYNGLMVSSADETPLDGIRVWDLAGRLSWMNESRNPSFEVSEKLFSSTAILVIQVRKGRQLISKKVIINPLQ